MILACDIGNSSSVFGIFSKTGELIKTFRTDTAKLVSADNLKKIILQNFNLADIKCASISSVVPTVETYFRILFDELNIKNLFISSKISLNIRLCVENREKLGADRIANACYARFIDKRFQIVVDLGTALTIDLVDDSGNFQGGIIYPGMSSLSHCLFLNAEKLPLITIEKEMEKRLNIIGTNTEMSILSGIRYGMIFVIEGFISGICDYCKCDINNTNIIFTGGHAGLIFKNINIKGNKIYDEFFTIKGIKYLYDLNTAV